MANTLTNLIAQAFATLDVVSRELIGMIPAVFRDGKADQVAKGQTIYVPITAANTAGEDITASMTGPAAADQTIGNADIVIDKFRAFPFSWTGEEINAMNHAGPGHNPLYNDQIAQAIRAATNEIEADLCGLHTKFSRAYGTAGTTPFGTAGDFTDASETLRILKDNGAPLSGNSLVMNTAAGAKLTGKQSNSSVAFEGTMLRQGILVDHMGLALRESAQILTPAAGTMASATSTSAAFTVGQTVIPLATAGTGIVGPGDVITFANDTNQYVVASATFAGANPASGDSIVLAAPGLRKAQGVATRAITVVAAAARNMAFNRTAIVLATRLPKRPAQGDMATDVFTIQDPRSGLIFNIAYYPGYHMGRFQLEIAWGKKVIKPAHTALLLG